MRRLSLLAVILVASPAAAEEGPRFAIGLDYTIARGGAFEALDLGWRLETGTFFRMGPWHGTLSVSTLMSVESDKPERDSRDLTGVGLGARLAYHRRIDVAGTIHVGLGFERIWLLGSAPVRRTCDQTGACLAGFYMETPAYDAWAPQLRVGIGPYKRLPTMLVGGTFEIIVEPIRFRDIPKYGVTDIALYGAFNFALGWGPKRRTSTQNL
jgi:hypothetical protein